MKKGLPWVGVTLVAFLCLLLGGLIGAAATYVLKNAPPQAAAQVQVYDPEQYYALVLGNGGVVFGKIVSNDSTEIVMTEVYAPQKDPKDKTGKNIVLTKAADNFYQPDGKMHLQRSSVLSIEQLAGDSRIITAIKAYKSKAE